MKTDRILSIARIAALVIICVACLVPFYVLLVLALNSPGRIFYEGNMFVPDFHFSNFIEAWEESRIWQAMVNSAIITAGTLALTIVLGGLAGYAIARRRTRFNGFVFGLLLSCMMIPGIINTVPLYTLMRRLHAVNTLYGMVLVCSTLALPSAVFIYSTFIASLPRELDEAAVRVLPAVAFQTEHPAGALRLLPAVRRCRLEHDGRDGDDRDRAGGRRLPRLPETVHKRTCQRGGQRMSI